jgi:hypothetical protein
MRSVRATRLEQRRRLPGDELIPHAVDSLTHAVLRFVHFVMERRQLLNIASRAEGDDGLLADLRNAGRRDRSRSPAPLPAVLGRGLLRGSC